MHRHLEKLNLDQSIRTSDNQNDDNTDIKYKIKPDKNSETSEKESDSIDTLPDMLFPDRGSFSDALDGNVDFQNPRSEKKTLDSSATSNSTGDPLPPPEELGCGHPFLLFVCLAVLLQERNQIMESKMEYDDMVMHFDKMARSHSPNKILSKAMRLFAEYLRSDTSCSYSST